MWRKVELKIGREKVKEGYGNSWKKRERGREMKREGGR